MINVWKKTSINIKDLPVTIEKLKLAIKNGDHSLEKMRCFYKISDNISYLLMPWDFIDNIPNIKTIKSFYLYTMEEK